MSMNEADIRPIRRTRKTTRRNFAAERKEIVAFCKLYINVLEGPMDGFPAELKWKTEGKMEAFQLVLKQMGE